MVSADGAPVAEPTFNPEQAPVVEAVTSTETVSPPTAELGAFMIPGDPDSYSVGPATATLIEGQETSSFATQEEVPALAPLLAEPNQLTESTQSMGVTLAPALETITAPSTTQSPETVAVRSGPELTTVATATTPRAVTTNAPASQKVEVKIELQPTKRGKVREVKQLSEPGQVAKAQLAELPSELEFLVGRKL